MSDVRAGVVGAGVFGRYHAGKYDADPRATLVGVYDPDAARCEESAAQHGARAFTSLDAMFAAVDVLTIASPAPTHAETALSAVVAGKHVLVEKPLGIEVAEAEAVARKAQDRGLVVQVGHQERFVFAAMGLLDVEETPQHVEAWRLNPFHERGSDVSVSLDLMTHDLDLVRLLAGRARATSIEADVSRERTDHPDRADARLTFANGMSAHVRASRLNEERERGMRVTYASGVVEVDFVAKTFTNGSAHTLNPDFADDPRAKDSLGAGVSAFLDAVIDGKPPAVSAEDGAAAVRLALAVDAAGLRAPAA